jgi:hypothetical protein
MMVVSYIHSKLDVVNYYISLLSNPKEAKNYNIPHSLRELKELKVHLNGLINEAINAKLPDKLRSGVLVAWPDGFEG